MTGGRKKEIKNERRTGWGRKGGRKEWQKE
jgi:hypothetical protein